MNPIPAVDFNKVCPKQSLKAALIHIRIQDVNLNSLSKKTLLSCFFMFSL